MKIEDLMEVLVKSINIDFNADDSHNPVMKIMVKLPIMIQEYLDKFDKIMDEMKKPTTEWNLKFYIGVSENE